MGNDLEKALIDIDKASKEINEIFHNETPICFKLDSIENILSEIKNELAELKLLLKKIPTIK